MRLFREALRRARYGKPVIVVSGLPRSGTSMVMNMLEAGGVPLLTDGLRASDENNPNGYFEFEPVKQLEENTDASWLPDARGKAVKIISFLLTWLPETYNYRVVFLQRDLDEVIASQNKMLAQRGDSGGATGDDKMRRIYTRHLQEVERFLSRRGCFMSLSVHYRTVIERPREEAGRISHFLGRPLGIDRMAAVVDRRLYRNRDRTD
jgi:hypothetical protein